MLWAGECVIIKQSLEYGWYVGIWNIWWPNSFRHAVFSKLWNLPENAILFYLYTILFIYFERNSIFTKILQNFFTLWIIQLSTFFKNNSHYVESPILFSLQANLNCEFNAPCLFILPSSSSITRQQDRANRFPFAKSNATVACAVNTNFRKRGKGRITF